MALSRARKQEILDELRRRAGECHRTPSCSATRASRCRRSPTCARACAQKGGKYLVVKNTLALTGGRGQCRSRPLESHFTGPTAVAYGDDPVALAKVLHGLRQGRSGIRVQGRLWSTARSIAGADRSRRSRRCPSREELIAKLLFLLQSPITRFVRVLARGAAAVRGGAGPDPADQREQAGLTLARLAISETGPGPSPRAQGERRWRSRRRSSSSRSTA